MPWAAGRVAVAQGSAQGAGDLMRSRDNSEGRKGDRIDASWWMDLGVRALHPIQIKIIEALRWIDHPISAADLALVLDGPSRLAIIHQLGRLTKLKAVAPVGSKGRNQREVLYRLISEPLEDYR